MFINKKELVLGGNSAVDHPDISDSTLMAIESGGDDEGAGRGSGGGYGRRETADNLLENSGNVEAAFGADGDNFFFAEAKSVDEFERGLVGVSDGQINFVDNGNDG